MITYPLNNIEYIAEDAELFHLTRTSGVYANNSFDYSASGADNTIVVGSGVAWIKNGEFSGKVVAQKEPVSLDLGLPDSVYPRIDAVVIQFDANKNSTEVVVKRGTAASAPIPPEVFRTESLYELHLYHIRREPGAAVVPVSNITDLRLEPNYCGLMADSVTQIDTEKISSQVTALINELQQEIQSVKDETFYLPRSGGSMSGNIDMSGFRIMNVDTPVEENEAVNKGYLDNAMKNVAMLDSTKKVKAEQASATVKVVANKTSYILTADDMGKLLILQNNSGGTTDVTIPEDLAMEQFPLGSEIEISKWNGGLAVNISVQGSVKIRTKTQNTLTTVSIDGNYGIIAFKRIANTIWYATGDIA
jgi:hypothetical protein